MSRLPTPEGERGLLVRVPTAPTCTAMAGTGSVGGALLTGTVPPDSPLVWPLVVLALGSMAYDLGVRALRRQRG
ncbi:hypothetical protein [Kitasatospora cathayae]|uniref:Holin n=1 Tax=Kitasatospora cathayae TaxID=3004092 RepID=A0ABY7QIU3_9ACTN|nr:hypothetical protein [Kitasatospora sp. HUAS 3-15]WBP92164.1 hypothetical protein O1G21_41190 [Kitasatospora sp. HUAS 3-15]